MSHLLCKQFLSIYYACNVCWTEGGQSLTQETCFIDAYQLATEGKTNYILNDNFDEGNHDIFLQNDISTRVNTIFIINTPHLTPTSDTQNNVFNESHLKQPDSRSNKMDIIHNTSKQNTPIPTSSIHSDSKSTSANPRPDSGFQFIRRPISQPSSRTRAVRKTTKPLPTGPLNRRRTKNNISNEHEQ
jgi:hypothetical protein